MAASAYNILHGSVCRARHILKGTGVYRHLARLRREQFMSRDEISDLQLSRLRELLVHAGLHSPYYRELFRKDGIEIGPDFDLEYLPRLPLLRRDDVQQNLHTILCDDARNYVLNSSGGSTGNPVNFYQDDYYRNFSEAAGLLFTSWMGIHSGDKTAVFWGADRDFGSLSTASKIWLKFDRVKALNSFSMSEESIKRFIQELNVFKPRFIYGYAGSLYLAAKVISGSAPLNFRPAAVRSSAEMLYDIQREEIERAFRAKVYDFYGSREVNNLAAECAAHEGMHLLASGRIVEIVDDNGLPLADGQLGQIAVTDLTNSAFPFIRYLNGDMAVKSEKPCSCGRGYPMLTAIAGRVSDMIVVNGQFIHGEFFTHLFYGRPEVKQFQVIQDDFWNIRVLVVSRDEKACFDDIMDKMKKKVGNTVNVQLNLTDSIPPSPTGKYRFTISRVGQVSLDDTRSTPR